LDGCGEYDVYTELNGPKRRYDTRKPRRKGQEHNSNSNFDDAPKFTTDPGIFLPQRYHLKELHEWNPDATWILNQRPVSDWVESVLNHGGPMKLPNQLLQEAQIQGEPLNELDERDKPLNRNRNLTKAFLKSFYQSQVKIVRDFCQQYNHRLIEVNITDPNSGMQLIKALGRKQPHAAESNFTRAVACWGRHNTREERGK